MKPTRSLLWIALLLTASAALLPFLPQLTPLWLLLAAVAIGVALLDLGGGKQQPLPSVRRQLRHSIPVGAWSEVTLHLHHGGERPLTLTLHDHHPAEFEVTDLPRQLHLPPAHSARMSYRVRPRRRGDCAFRGCDLITLSPLGLWSYKRFRTLTDAVKVFPNFRDVHNFALLAGDNRLNQLGIRRRQRRGEGNDFHQLREYRPGDSLRQIDWKATSRYQRLISKEYQDERDQQIVFLLDCGRRMRHEEEGRLHLDQALNALLLLAYIATQQDDAVGFMAFGGIQRWYPPRKSGYVVREILEQTYNLHSTTEAADYLMAARELMTRQRRRALVIILSNTRNEDHEELMQAVRLLTRRHLVVLADLRESLLDETLRQPVHTFDQALTFHAAYHYLESRRRQHAAMRHQDALILDTLASQLPVALVNHYLSIKASGAL